MSDLISPGQRIRHYRRLDKAGRKGVKTTKENISKARDYFQRRKTNLPKKQAQNAMRRVRRSADTTQKAIKTVVL